MPNFAEKRNLSRARQYFARGLLQAGSAEAASGKVAAVSSIAEQSVSAPNASLVPLPAMPSSTGAPIDLSAQIGKISVLETYTKPLAGVSRGGEAASAATGVDLAKAACARTEGTKVRLYTQVYGEREFDAFSAAKSRPPGIDLAGTISFVSIENVDATAKKLGTRPPYRWSAPTLIYHNETERACAEKLADIYENAYGPKPNLRSLPERLKKQAGAIELWVPIGGAPKLTEKMPE